jgi:hypothetical protein
MNAYQQLLANYNSPAERNNYRCTEQGERDGQDQWDLLVVTLSSGEYPTGRQAVRTTENIGDSALPGRQPLETIARNGCADFRNAQIIGDSWVSRTRQVVRRSSGADGVQ